VEFIVVVIPIAGQKPLAQVEVQSRALAEGTGKFTGNFFSFGPLPILAPLHGAN
jgi:hypothetical protein